MQITIDDLSLFAPKTITVHLRSGIELSGEFQRLGKDVFLEETGQVNRIHIMAISDIIAITLDLPDEEALKQCMEKGKERAEIRASTTMT